VAPAPSLLCLRGSLVVEGKAPDGDSIRLIPDSPELLDELRRADRIRRSRDGSVQLRLEGIDAPETSYGPAGQPLGVVARNRLLKLAGFTGVKRAPGSATVTSARPNRVPAAALAQLADANGRPVCFLITGHDLPTDGEYASLDQDGLLERSLNHALLEDGTAYLTLYDSLPPALRRRLRATAAQAREADLGVWARDTTAEFELIDQESIGPQGQLILPKLFRRCTDYLDTRSSRRQTLPQWLRETGDDRRPEDDRVIVAERIETRLSELVEQRNRTIAFSADPLDLIFIEK
jgi:endonuclease YncB( thermonuclease family)